MTLDEEAMVAWRQQDDVMVCNLIKIELPQFGIVVGLSYREH